MSLVKFGILLFQIREISNLNHLCHLRVLNLAGNDITVLKGVSGLIALSELNLRRNRITQVLHYGYERDCLLLLILYSAMRLTLLVFSDYT